MAEVVIAPARRLGQNPQTSINDQEYLPTGNSQAVIRQRLNDDAVTTLDNAPLVANAKERNDTYREQVLWYNKRDLIGKHGSWLKPLVNDNSIMNKFNIDNDDRIARQAYLDYRLKCCNLVSMPFVTAEPMILPNGTLPHAP